MTKEIIVCRCPNCYDTFEVTSDVLGVKYFNKQVHNYNDYVMSKDFIKELQWWTESKVCLNCEKEYIPLGTGLKMDNFVLGALKRCKM